MKIETQIAKFDQSIEDFVHCKVNAVLVLEYSSRDRQEMLDELQVSA